MVGHASLRGTGDFEVEVAGKLVHSKNGGDGYVDTQQKVYKIATAIESVLEQ